VDKKSNKINYKKSHPPSSRLPRAYICYIVTVSVQSKITFINFVKCSHGIEAHSDAYRWHAIDIIPHDHTYIPYHTTSVLNTYFYELQTNTSLLPSMDQSQGLKLKKAA
jgi:hypothetical protein